jgi:dTDP-4-dehydrorhamnose reductase
MRVLVLGAGGMLGHKVCQAFAGHERFGLVRRPAAHYDRHRRVFAGVELVGGIDVLDGAALEATLRRLAPEAVVNCVGLVKQHEAAEDPYLAVALNALLPHRLARLAAELGARLVHVSTDCVFDGSRGGYRESDRSDATDLYGRSKALGETTPRQTAAVTLRTSFIGRELGRSPHGLLEWLLDQDGGAVDGYVRSIYSGLTALELAGVIRRVVERHPQLSGVYQVGGPTISKYDLLRLLAETYGLEVEIRPSDEPVVDRSLVTDAFEQATGYSAPRWREMILKTFHDPTPYDAPPATERS